MKKAFLIISIVAFTVSCGLGKKAKQTPQDEAVVTEVQVADTESNTETDQAMLQNGLIMSEGYVRDRSADGCGFLIEVLVEGRDSMLVQPLSLPEIHQVDGKHVKLTYRMSRRPSTCSIGAPIVIEKIIG